MWQTIMKPAKGEDYGYNIEFATMCNSARVAKQVIEDLLRKHNLLIEYQTAYGRKFAQATYRDVKLIERTDVEIVLVFNTLCNKEIEISIEDIRNIRIF